ncbi:MAG: peptidoglycan DD-metalloendopeptidase family protein [Rikenellaceae bacterium]|jgi:septal ring factor EnvC (AmiA/AmiB activator)|nr:peptidoglycan DD-metalloendopeptidase family protein [Rikenellaceae bacterium]
MRRLVIFLGLFLFAGDLGAQSVQSLRDQIRKAEEEIRISSQLLEKNRKEQKMSLAQIEIIHSRIESRREMVAALEREIAMVSGDIAAKTGDIERLRADLDRLKKEYATMVYVGYKNFKLNNFTLFIFSARDFHDATRRISYLRRFNVSCEQKAFQIDSLSKGLARQVSSLSAKKQELSRTKLTRGNELTALGKDESNYKASVEELKRNESKLATTVRNRQAQIAKAQQQIQRIVAAEAKKAQQARLKASAAEKKQDAALTGRFGGNMGRLPFPITGGVIVDRYGVHELPTLRGVKVDNRGINIAAPGGSEVRAVFDGVVSTVFACQGLRTGVAIRHGNYITIYANLASVAIKSGDKVSTNQRIGAIPNTGDTADFMLHFEIWREKTNLDPSLWLRR